MKDIVKLKLVKKTDGTVPQPSAISEAAATFKEEKRKRGRKQGWRKTTKSEDKQILTTFKKLRPPGYGVDSRDIHKALPKKLRKKVGRDTIISRLAEKGYTAQKKINKSDNGVKWRQRRLKFAKKYKEWTPDDWKSQVQAVGDIKPFTFYPKVLRPRFKQLRAPWTYMTKAEKKLPAFLRPKRWFPQKDWKKTKKQKVFGMTTTTGDKLSFLWPDGATAAFFASKVRSHVGPFLKKCFPTKSSFVVLLDGEGLLHAPPAKAAFADFGIKAFPGWPASSPDLNPQENVWPQAERRLRVLDKDDNSTFADFQKVALKAVRDYPTASAKRLVPSMTQRLEEVIQREGGIIDW